MTRIEAVELRTGDAPTATVIVLHGLGADGYDFVPVCEALDLSAVGAVRFVLPHAPEQAVTINGGYRMRAWYDIHPEPGDGRPRLEDEAGLRASLGLVETLIAHEKQRGIPASRIVLAGFSQGCALTLLAGVRHGERLAGLAGLSGYLPLAGHTAAERSAACAGLPIFLAHGRDDDIVLPARGAAARDQLRALGYDLSWHEYDMPHAVCNDEIADLNAWLLQVLAPGRGA